MNKCKAIYVSPENSLLTLVLLIFAQPLKIARQQLHTSTDRPRHSALSNISVLQQASNHVVLRTDINIYIYIYIQIHIHMQLHMQVALPMCVCVCVVLIYMAHIPYENSQLFIMSASARQSVCIFAQI